MSKQANEQEHSKSYMWGIILVTFIVLSGFLLYSFKTVSKNVMSREELIVTMEYLEAMGFPERGDATFYVPDPNSSEETKVVITISVQ